MSWLFSTRQQTSADERRPEVLTLEQLDDRGLMSLARQGDAAAFSALYQRHRMSVYRYISYRTMSLRDDVAEDLTAEVFLNAWRTVESYRERGATVRSWFLRMAHNEVVDHYRTRRPEATLPEDGPLAPSLEGPELALEGKASRGALLRAVARLTGEAQQVILLRFVEELSFEEIGVVLGKHGNACRQIQHRALARLRALLAEERSHDG